MIGDAILQKATEHFAAKVAGDEMYSVAVPEWDTTLYFKPATLAEQDKLYRAIQDGGLGGLVEVLIIRARDEDGNKLFKNAHRFELMNKVDPVVLDRISLELANQEAADKGDLGNG
jgi:hypothetical protein